MLALVSPLGNIKNERGGEIDGFSVGGASEEFPDFSDDNLLESIDFDDLFIGMDDGDVLPDLEMDPENILADFSVSGGEDSLSGDRKFQDEENSRKDEEDKVSGSGSCLIQGEEIVSKREETATAKDFLKESERGRKSSSGHSKNVHSKRKVKVDWTPELHRRFVQAVEQLGVDKAVPSRILEIMGIDCLTRHNIASHLQKYRSHRKHLLAREAEAASWSQRRQMYGGGAAPGGGAGGKRDMSPWLQAAPPTMGFPPMPPVPHFRTLHVWGHPSMDRPVMPVWPKHITPSPSPPPPHLWAQPPPLSPHHPSAPPNPTFWHSHHQRVPNTIPPGSPYFPPHLAAARYPTPPVLAPGIPPHAMYKVDPGTGTIPTAGKSCPNPPFDFQPTKESIDAAIGDILSKPWQPLPLGLKPPVLDSVLVELQRQGIQKVPPAACV